MGRIKFKNIIFLVLVTTIVCSDADRVFIIIHGTWATHEIWYTSGGDFFDTFKKKAAQQQATVTSYRWSGHNNHHARVIAAQELVQLIQSYPPEKNICLVSHSHGSNVGILASQFLSKRTKNTHHIHIFYALGTPVNQHNYYPNMDIITYFYNLFSLEDMIQPVLGMFSREYKKHERIANIRITINNKEPFHAQLHDPVIAQWLPTLHEFLSTSFCFFDFQQPGILHFAENQELVYEVDPERKKDIDRDTLLNKMLLSTLFRGHNSTYTNNLYSNRLFHVLLPQ